MERKIPKKIHYCWFGGSPLPEDALKCIASWKKYCPGYEIIQWDESNYDVQSKCTYVKQAYDASKWAFVSDYARFDILNQYGGVYLDTDVELIAPIDDIIARGPFLGCEMSDVLGKNVQVNTGVGFALPENHWLCSTILKEYEADEFVFPSGRYNPNNVVSRISAILKERGFRGRNEKELIRDIAIYPTDYFCPVNYFSGEKKLTTNTRSIHHYTATWRNKFEKASTKIKAKSVKLFGFRVGSVIARIISVPLWAIGKIQEKGFLGFLRYCGKRMRGEK